MNVRDVPSKNVASAIFFIFREKRKIHIFLNYLKILQKRITVITANILGYYIIKRKTIVNGMIMPKSGLTVSSVYLQWE